MTADIPRSSILTADDLVNIKHTVLTIERQEIARNIDPKRFFGHLRAKYVFDETDCDEIRSVPSRVGSAEVFVDTLKRKGGRGYDEFCNALMNDKTQMFLLQRLTQTLELLRAKVIERKAEKNMTAQHMANKAPPPSTLQQHHHFCTPPQMTNIQPYHHHQFPSNHYSNTMPRPSLSTSEPGNTGIHYQQPPYHSSGKGDISGTMIGHHGSHTLPHLPQHSVPIHHQQQNCPAPSLPYNNPPLGTTPNNTSQKPVRKMQARQMDSTSPGSFQPLPLSLPDCPSSTGTVPTFGFDPNRYSTTSSVNNQQYFSQSFHQPQPSFNTMANYSIPSGNHQMSPWQQQGTMSLPTMYSRGNSDPPTPTGHVSPLYFMREELAAQDQPCGQVILARGFSNVSHLICRPFHIVKPSQ